MAHCLFCKIANHELPAKAVLETDQAIAFADINPQAPIHVIIIAKDHQKTDLDWIDLAKQVAEKTEVAKSGFRLIINQGKDAHQDIDHLHMHLLAGKDLGPMLNK